MSPMAETTPPGSEALDRSEQTIFSELQTLCASPGFIHALAFLSWRDTFISYNKRLKTSDVAKSYNREFLVRTEFNTLLGLLFKSSIDFSLPPPHLTQQYIDTSERLLRELHDALGRPMRSIFNAAFLEKSNDPSSHGSEFSPFRDASSLREPIFYCGESAYNFQFRDLAPQRYCRDAEWIQNNRGFNIEQASEVVRAIGALSEQKLSQLKKTFRKKNLYELTVLPVFTFNISEVALKSSISEGIVEKVIAAISVRNFPDNVQFTGLGEFNKATSNPIIMIDDSNFISFNTYNMFETLYDSPFYWMFSDKIYRSTAAVNRGLFTEEIVYEMMIRIFGRNNVWKNVIVSKSKSERFGEIDVLVLFGKRAIIFQCKSKKLTLTSQRGNDNTLKDDFKKAVQDSYDQAYSCATVLLMESVVAHDENGQIAIPKNLKQIFPITVVSDHYPALSAQAKELLLLYDNPAVSPPITTDIFLIDVASEFLDSPLYFLSYLDRRSEYFGRIVAMQETALLGYHLKHNIWFEDDLSFAVIDDDFSTDVDTSMMVRRQGVPGPRTPIGILTRFSNTSVGQIISEIKSSDESELIDLGFLLLSLSEDALRNIDNGMQYIARKARSDGKNHDFSMSFEGQKSGITIHCNNIEMQSAGESLRRHCQIRKYISKAERWYGLIVTPSSVSVRLGLCLDGVWVYSDLLERMSSGMSRLSSAGLEGGTVKKLKPGRNETCPCGSGVKFKRCCAQRDKS